MTDELSDCAVEPAHELDFSQDSFSFLTPEDAELFDFDDLQDLQTIFPVISSCSNRVYAPAELAPVNRGKPHRRSRASIQSDVLSLEAVQLTVTQTCPCANKPAGQPCMRHFQIGDVFSLRAQRWTLNPVDDQQARYQDLVSGLQHNTKNPKMLVLGKLICLRAYCLVYAYARTSLYRTLAAARKGLGIAPVGRPQGTGPRDVLGDSRKNLTCYTWLKDWVDCIGDDDPVGKSCKKVINFVSVKEVHAEYCKSYLLTSVLQNDQALSERRFRQIWEYFLEKEHVRVRRKANTTTKCATCDDLHRRASAIAVTRAELKAIAEARAEHRDDIRSLRLRYMDDIQRAQSTYRFQTIVFDGTNSNTCKCPQDWRAHMRDEKSNNTFVQQKIQSILIHGVALLFYIVTPTVPLGMNLTISTLMDALQYIDPRTEVVRFQYDGESTACRWT